MITTPSATDAGLIGVKNDTYNVSPAGTAGSAENVVIGFLVPESKRSGQSTLETTFPFEADPQKMAGVTVTGPPVNVFKTGVTLLK